MKIKKVRQITAHRVETDNRDFPDHTRYGPNSWTVSMGESEEQVYEFPELEAAFQAFVAMDQATCNHKFIDSQHCLLCGWVPPNDGDRPG